MDDTDRHFKLRVTMRDGARVVRGIPCEVCLPLRPTGPVEVRLHSSTPHRLGYPFRFSIAGSVSRTGRRVRASRVFWKQGGKLVEWSPSLAEQVLLGDPIDLTVTDPLFGARRQRRPTRAHVAYWITPNFHLQPFKDRRTSYTGRVTVLRTPVRQFTVSGVRLTFDRYFRYATGEDGTEITFTEPVAAGWVPRLAAVPALLAPLEDVLLLASFAARQRTVCVGWEAADSSVRELHYRRGISIPREKTGHGSNQVLISPEDFASFLRRAHRVFSRAPEQDLLRQSIQQLVYDDDNALLTSTFLLFFGAAEALVLRFRRLYGMENILPPRSWRSVSRRVRRAIETDDTLTADTVSLVTEKIAELNRVPFAAAVRGFCRKHQVDLSDLWLLVATDGGVSLANIRNRFSHGELIGDEEYRVLLFAREHLRWTVERMVLGLFGWPMNRSQVHGGVAATIPDHHLAQAVIVSSSFGDDKPDRFIPSKAAVSIGADVAPVSCVPSSRSCLVNLTRSCCQEIPN